MFFRAVHHWFKTQRWPESKGIVLGVGIVFTFTMSLSGIIGIGSLFGWVECWVDSETRAAAWIRTNTSRDAVIFFPRKTLHFAAALTGRQNFCGPEEVLAREGLDADACAAEVERWTSVGDGTLPVDYVIVPLSSEKKAVLMLNNSFWQQVHSTYRMIVYQKIT
jgi:hypothetical protein